MRLPLIALVVLAAGVTAACAYRGDYGYAPDPYGEDGMRYGEYSYFGDRFAGRGADLLDPWLADTKEGRTIVAAGFSGAADGRIDAGTADRANVWFRRYADTDADLRLTDEEIRVALVQAARDQDYW